MDVKTALTTRRSVHNFDPQKEIDEKTLHDIFELVRYTPSSFNLQPVEFLVVTDKKKKEQLKEAAWGQQHVMDASAVAILLACKDPNTWAADTFADWKQKGYIDEKGAENFRGMVDSMVSQSGEMGMKAWAHKHAGIYGMALMAAAMHYGVQTEPMEGFDAKKVQELFSIPDTYEMPMFVCMGYQNKEQLPRLSRKSFNQLVRLNKF